MIDPIDEPLTDTAKYQRGTFSPLMIGADSVGSVVKLGMSDARRSRLYIVGGAALIALGITSFMWIFFSDDVFATSTVTADRIDLWVIARLAAGASMAGGAWLLALAYHRRRGTSG